MRVSTATVAALMLAVGTLCMTADGHPQTSPQEPVAATTKLNLTLEQRHVIREIIKDSKPEPVSGSVKAEVGEKMPTDVKPQAMPTQVAQKVPQIKAHEFFVADGQIVIVDPKDNRIAEVIKLSAD
jgi:uncharacterized protein DUF1236